MRIQLGPQKRRVALDASTRRKFAVSSSTWPSDHVSAGDVLCPSLRRIGALWPLPLSLPPPPLLQRNVAVAKANAAPERGQLVVVKGGAIVRETWPEGQVGEDALMQTYDAHWREQHDVLQAELDARYSERDLGSSPTTLPTAAAPPPKSKVVTSASASERNGINPFPAGLTVASSPHPIPPTSTLLLVPATP